MRVLFDINHPAHVHLFKHAIWELQKEGHSIKITSRDKDIAIDLLDQYGFQHQLLSATSDSLGGLAIELLQKDLRLLNICRQFEPDVLIGLHPSITHVSCITDSQSIIMHDTGHAEIKEKIFAPFADKICIPTCYLGTIESKATKYPSYHELAYLHPDRFTPDDTILNDIDIDDDERFIIMRTVGWDAIHDVGNAGIPDIIKIVKKLEERGIRVIITAESELPGEIAHCQVTVDPHRMHHLMYYADLYVGESATMATESAVLGTPAIFMSTYECGNTRELDEKYGLVFSYQGEQRQSKAFEKATSILEHYEQDQWEKKRQKMLKDKIDPNSFIIKQIKEAAKK